MSKSDPKSKMVSADVLMDRLLSATSPSDATDSLESLVKWIQSCPAIANEENDQESISMLFSLVASMDFMEVVCSLLSSGELTSPTSGSRMEVEDGGELCCDVLLALLDWNERRKRLLEGSSRFASFGNNKSNTGNNKQNVIQLLLSIPSEGRIVSSLLDLLCPSLLPDQSPRPSYARMQASAVLRKLLAFSPSATNHQLLLAPNGLHRLVDLLDSPPTPEEIRNDALLLCADIARSSSASARLMMFGEALEKAAQAAMTEGGLLGGAVVVADSVRLCLELVQSDTMAADLILSGGGGEGSGALGSLGGLLDLRRGKAFVHPDTTPLAQHNSQAGEEDDLDELLGTSSDPSNTKTAKTKQTPVPALTAGEEAIVSSVVDFLSVILLGYIPTNQTNDTDNTDDDENDKASVKKRAERFHTIASRYDVALRLLLDLALYSAPPSPSIPHVCAVPSTSLQLRALEAVAALCRRTSDDDNVVATLLRQTSVYLPGAGTLDRILYLACTGGSPFAVTANDNSRATERQKQISAGALAVLRLTISSDDASLMVMHALAPPMANDDDNDEGGQQQVASSTRGPGIPLDPFAVQRLVHMLTENLRLLTSPNNNADEDKAAMRVNAIGSASALGVFLTNGVGDTTREMLLRVRPSPPQPNQDDPDAASSSQSQTTGLMGCLVSFLEATVSTMQEDGGGEEENSTSSTRDNNLDDVICAILKLLSEWIQNCHPAISALLSDPGSVSLGWLLQPTQKKKQQQSRLGHDSSASAAATGVTALTALLLGSCMEYMSSTDDLGGWSRSGILNLIGRGMGMGRFTALLEAYKGDCLRRPIVVFGAEDKSSSQQWPPWARCESERASFISWYGEAVSVVRRRTVKELTNAGMGDGGDGEDDNEMDGDDTIGTSGARDSKSLARLASQQSTELEALRTQLAEAQKSLLSKDHKLALLKKRVESDPTSMDDVLQEYIGRIEELERTNNELAEEMEELRSSHSEMMRQKETNLEALRSDLGASRERERLVSDERDGLQSDLEGLSAAYGGLEAEYNRVMRSENNLRAGSTVSAPGGNVTIIPPTTPTTTEAAAPTREGADASSFYNSATATFEHGAPTTQTEGDDTTESMAPSSASTTEERRVLASTTTNSAATAPSNHDNVDFRRQIHTLRTENTQLKADVRAANEWMSMAVGRMEEMGGQKDALEKEVQDLRAAVATSTITSSTFAEVNKDERGGAVEAAMGAAATEELVETGRRLVETEEERDALRVELDDARDQLRTQEGQLQQQNEQLQQRGLDVPSENQQEQQKLLAQLRAEHEGIIAQKNTELDTVRAELQSTKDGHNTDIQAREMELQALNGDLIRVKLESEKARKQMETVVRESEVLIERKDETISDLEIKLRAATVDGSSGGSTGPTAVTVDKAESIADTAKATEIASLENEIQRLRDANQAAQEWMANAVTHNESMTNRINELQEELHRAIASAADSKAVDSATAAELNMEVSNLERQIEEVTRERDDAMGKIAQMQYDLDANASGHVADGSHADELKQMELQLADRDNQIQGLSEELVRFQSIEKERPIVDTSEMVSIQSQLDERNRELEFVKTRLEESEATLQHRESQLRQDVDQSKDEVRRITLQLESMRAIQSKSDETNDSNEGLKCHIEAVSSERDRLKIMLEDLRRESDESRFSVEALTSERQTHVATIDSMRTRMEEFNSWIEMAKQRIADLEGDNEAYQSKITQLEEEGKGTEAEAKHLEKEKEDLARQAEELIAVKDSTLAKMSAQEAEVSDLRIRLTKTEADNGQLLNDKSVLQVELNSLRIENAGVLGKIERLEELEKLVSDRDVALAQAHRDLEENQSQSQDIVQQWQDRVEELEQATKTMEEDMLKRDLGAKAAIDQWEARCSELTESITQLSGSLNASAAAKEESDEALKQIKAQHIETEESLESRVKELELDVASKESKLEELKRYQDTAEAHQATIEDLQMQIQERDQSILMAGEQMEALTSEVLETRDQSDYAVNQWKERTEELEEMLSELQKDRDEEYNQADDAIGQWEARCGELAEQIVELEKHVTESSMSEKASKDELEQTRNKFNETLADAETKIKSKEADINNIKSAHSELAQILDSEKQANLALQQKLSSETTGRVNANNENVSLKGEMEKLKRSNSEIGSALVNERQARSELQQLLNDEKRQHSDSRREWEDRWARLEAESAQSKATLERKLSEEQKRSRENSRKWDAEKRSLVETDANLKREMAEIKAVSGQLEDELQAANETLQSHLTDEISVRATEVATQALRAQINEIRSMHAVDKEKLTTEHNLRLLAEGELGKVKRDLALVASSGKNGDSLDGNVRKITSKATDELVRKERQEITELRVALEHVMEELSSSRINERAAEEKAASSRLQASVCEQELLATKSDLDYVRRVVEEMRESESSTRSALEFRIGSLEEEREALLRTQADEVETLKTEIAQMNIERERLAHSLSESEKANTALVFSTSVNAEEDGASSEKTELTKLRLEKEQLLATIGELGSKAEHRIREAIVAHASSVEADAILERELRESAEAAVDDLQAQVDDLKKRMLDAKDSARCATTNISVDKKTGEERSILSTNELDAMKSELKRLEDTVKTLRTENKNIVSRMDKATTDSQHTIMKLTEKCRIAESRAREIEREGHFEAAVAAEISRLRTESSTAHRPDMNGDTENANGRSVVRVSGGMENGIDSDRRYWGAMTVEELSDIVMELEAELREERHEHQKLLVEHENLLAALAQSELECASIKDVLVELGGREAVSDAVRKAEGDALNTFVKATTME